MMKIRTFLFPIGTLWSTIAIFPRAFRGYFTRILLLSVLGFFTGLIEGIGITILIPLFTFFDNSERQPTDFISRTIEHFFAFLHIPFTLPAVLLLIIFLFLLKFAVVMLYSYIAVRIRTGYERNTMDQLLKTTLRADWPYLLKQKLGRLETLIKIDSRESGRMLEAISTTLTIGATTAAYFLVAMNISQTVTAVALVFGAISFILYKPLFSLARSLSQQTSGMNVAIAHHINKSIVGIKTIKALGAEDQLVVLGEGLFGTLRKLQLRSILLGKVVAESMQPIGIIFITAIIAFTFYKTSYNLGALAALIYLINRIFQYIQQIQGAIHNISSTLPYVENITSYLEEARTAKESRHTNEEDRLSSTKLSRSNQSIFPTLAKRSASFRFIQRGKRRDDWFCRSFGAGKLRYLTLSSASSSRTLERYQLMGKHLFYQHRRLAPKYILCITRCIYTQRYGTQ